MELIPDNAGRGADPPRGISALRGKKAVRMLHNGRAPFLIGLIPLGVHNSPDGANMYLGF